MFERLKKSLQEFKQAEPGKRFTERYYKRQKAGRSIRQKVLHIAGGLLLAAAGVVFLFIPGPGTVVLLIGAGLIAQESLPGARALDWAEVRIRKIMQAIVLAWRGTSLLTRLLFIAIGLIVAGGVAAGAYYVFLAGS